MGHSALKIQAELNYFGKSTRSEEIGKLEP